MSSAGIGSVPIWIAGAVVVSVAVGGAIWYGGQSTAPDAQNAIAPAAQPDQAAPEGTDTVAQETPKQEPEPELLTRLDEVRVEAGGLAIVAGRTDPFAQVILRADGTEIARATADSAGAFATVATLAPSETARVLSIARLDDAGVEGQIEDELILAPVSQVVSVETNAVDESDKIKTADGETATDDTPEQLVDDVNTASLQEPETQVRVTTADVETNAPITDPEQAQTEAAALEADLATPVAPDVTVLPNALSVTKEADTLPDTSGLAQAAGATALDLQDEVAALDAEGVAQPGTVANVTLNDGLDGQTGLQTPQAPAKPQSFAVLRANRDGVEVLQPASPSPQAQSQVALDAISYSLEGDVQLTGRAQQSADQVQVYLNNQSIAVLQVDDAGAWRGALPNIDTGVYTLRIDELNDEGRVTSRVETPFKREDPAVLLSATEQAGESIKAITVQKGATLWAIARERYGDGTLYVRVFEANNDTIRDPDLIYPGQVFNLPEN